MLKRYEQAIESFDKAIELNPTDKVAFLAYGRLLKELGRYKKSLELFQKALEIDIKYLAAYERLIESFDYLENYQEGIIWCTKAISNNCTSEYLVKQKFNFERRLLETLYNHKKEKFDFSTKGIELYNQERYERALDCFDKAIEQYPDDYSDYFYCGKILIKLKRYKAAIESLTKAINLNHLDGNIFFHLGYCYHSIEEFDEAVFYYREALILDPSCSGARDNLDILEKAGY